MAPCLALTLKEVGSAGNQPLCAEVDGVGQGLRIEDGNVEPVAEGLQLALPHVVHGLLEPPEVALLQRLSYAHSLAERVHADGVVHKVDLGPTASLTARNHSMFSSGSCTKWSFMAGNPSPTANSESSTAYSIESPRML